MCKITFSNGSNRLKCKGANPHAVDTYNFDNYMFRFLVQVVLAVAPVVVLRMVVSKLGGATRAFVTVLLFLARRYEVVLEVSRDSPAELLPKFLLGHVGAHGRWTPHKQTRRRTTAPEAQNSKDRPRNPSTKAWAYSDPTALSRDESSFRILVTRNSPPTPL